MESLALAGDPWLGESVTQQLVLPSQQSAALRLVPSLSAGVSQQQWAVGTCTERKRRDWLHLVHLGLYVWVPKCGREKWKTSFLSWWGQTAWICRNCRETKNLQITGFWRCWNIGWFVRLEPFLDMGKVKWGRTHLFFWSAHLGLCSILLTFQTFVP